MCRWQRRIVVVLVAVAGCGDGGAVARDGWDVAALEARIDEVDGALHSVGLEGAAADDLEGFEASVEEARAFVSERRAYLEGLLDLSR